MGEVEFEQKTLTKEVGNALQEMERCEQELRLSTHRVWISRTQKGHTQKGQV